MSHGSLVANLLPPSWWECSADDIAALAPIQSINWPVFTDNCVSVAIKRDDLLDPAISGNKFYKLLGHIAAFRRSGQKQWLTFGGAHSNHLLAFAAASSQMGVKAVAVIRGEQPAVFSPTLVDALALGVQLIFVSREDYRQRENPEWIARLKNQLGDFYCVPEGGCGLPGTLGCATWIERSLALTQWTPSAICLAAGTGCSAAGVWAAAGTTPVHGYLALKGDAESNARFWQQTATLAIQTAELRGSSRQLSAFILEADYHCGGYARLPPYLREFMFEFEDHTQVPLDPVYTAKMFWGINEQVKTGYWPRGTKLLVLHSGGLQGRRGFSGLDR